MPTYILMSTPTPDGRRDCRVSQASWEVVLYVLGLGVRRIPSSMFGNFSAAAPKSDVALPRAFLNWDPTFLAGG